jgi:hypothetical protein
VTGYQVKPVDRVLTVAEGDATLGDWVGEREPNVTTATVFADSDSGEPVLAYLPVPGGLAGLRRAVLQVRFNTETLRGGTGMRNRSRTFGMAPRKVVQQREACRPAALAHEQPAEHAAVVEVADRVAAMLREIAPEVYEHDRTVMGQVDGDWRLTAESLWTSGVINKASRLPYHRDAFNFATWSAMPVVRRGMAGGYLHLPEWDLTVACRDGWAVMFPGWKYVHGVTPMRPTAPDGYRYSVVYYALKGMKNCFEHAIEVAEGRRRRTARETITEGRMKIGKTIKLQGSPS